MVSPLAGTRVIHDAWAAHHQPTAKDTMKSPAVFTRISDGPPPYPKPAGWTGGTVLWETKVRVQAMVQRFGVPVPAEQPSVERRYLITCPVDGPELRAGERGDVITTGGRAFNIISIAQGTYEFERALLCVENITQQNPT